MNMTVNLPVPYITEISGHDWTAIKFSVMNEHDAV